MGRVKQLLDVGLGQMLSSRHSCLLHLQGGRPSDPGQRAEQGAAFDAKRMASRGLCGPGVQCRDQGAELLRIDGGRPAPPRRPRRRAAASPACTRSWMSARSNWARAPNIWNRNSPCGVVVSICSVSERKAMHRVLKSVTVVSRCGNDRPSRSSFQTIRQSPG